MKLNTLLQRKEMLALHQESLDRKFAEGLFEEWRDRFVAALCAYIRFQRLAQDEKPWHTVDWCNAAVHLLTVPDIGTQDQFLRADDRTKDEMVQAVLEDGGIVNLIGVFVELPLL